MPVGGLRDFRMLSGVCALLGVVLCGCALLPSSPLAPPVINAVAGFVLFGIGGVLWWISRPKKVARG